MQNTILTHHIPVDINVVYDMKCVVILQHFLHIFKKEKKNNELKESQGTLLHKIFGFTTH